MQCKISTVRNMSMYQVEVYSSHQLYFVDCGHNTKENLATWWTAVMSKHPANYYAKITIYPQAAFSIRYHRVCWSSINTFKIIPVCEE